MSSATDPLRLRVLSEHEASEAADLFLKNGSRSGVSGRGAEVFFMNCPEALVCGTEAGCERPGPESVDHKMGRAAAVRLNRRVVLFHLDLPGQAVGQGLL